MKILFFTIILFLLGNKASNAQQQDASPAGVMISHAHPKGGWMFNYSFMHMNMGGNFKGNEKISNEEIFNSYLMAGTSMKMDMHMLMAMHGITGRFTIMVMANYVSNSMDMTMYEGAVGAHNHSGSDVAQPQENMTMNTSGISDTKIHGIYKLMNGEKSSLVASLGVNVPTGNYKISGNPCSSTPNERYPYMMQTGTGSVDFSPGFTYLSAGNKFNWSSQLIGTLRPFKNDIGYHYGSELYLNCWGGYKIKRFASTSLRLEAITTAGMSGKDATLPMTNEPSSDYKNYGGQKINSYLGVNFFLNKGFLKESKFAVEYGIPVYQNYNGIQQGLKGIVVAGVTVSL
ncbi:MAG TPA: transporter [Bacteroidia bacterium]|nr:transporter [Bacteroidia bacterium]